FGVVFATQEDLEPGLAIGQEDLVKQGTAALANLGIAIGQACAQRAFSGPAELAQLARSLLACRKGPRSQPPYEVSCRLSSTGQAQAHQKNRPHEKLRPSAVISFSRPTTAATSSRRPRGQRHWRSPRSWERYPTA